MGVKTKFLFVIFSLFFGSSAFAQQGLVFSPAFLVFSFDEEENSSTFAKVDAQYMDFSLGYIMSQGVYLGGLYSQMKREDGNTKRTRTSYGAALGFVYKQFFLIGHYIIESTYETSPNSELKDGNGFQGNIGYWFPVTGPFHVGPQLVLRNITYSKRNTSETDATTSETLPYLSLAFIF